MKLKIKNNEVIYENDVYKFRTQFTNNELTILIFDFNNDEECLFLTPDGVLITHICAYGFGGLTITV